MNLFPCTFYSFMQILFVSFPQEYSSEAYQERLNFQYARISEVNQHLEALIESSERGFPLHMNLAFRLPPQGVKMGTKMATSKDANNNRTVLRLRDQNRQLTEVC